MITNRQRTALIKKHFKQNYGVVPTVRYDSFSGGDSLNVEWVGGPPSKLIEREFAGIVYGTFDGMTDAVLANLSRTRSISYNYDHNRRGTVICGEELPPVKYFSARQEIPDEFRFRVACLLSERYELEGTHKCLTLADYGRDFEVPGYGGAWNWRNAAYRALQGAHFVTSDFDGIEILDLADSVNGSWCVSVIYLYEGKVYSTNDYPEAA